MQPLPLRPSRASVTLGTIAGAALRFADEASPAAPASRPGPRARVEVVRFVSFRRRGARPEIRARMAIANLRRRSPGWRGGFQA